MDNTLTTRLIDRAVFHVNPPSDAPEEDAITAERLISIAQGLSEIVSGLADEKRTDEVDERQRSATTKEEKSHYSLYFRPPEIGSFSLPCEIYDMREGIENQEPLLPDCESGFGQIAHLIALANIGDREAFNSEVPSPVVASKIGKGIEKLAPNRGESVELILPNSENSSICVERSAAENIIEWSSLYEGPFTQELVVTVSSIDFDDNSLRVKLVSGGRKFKAPLSEELSAIKLEAFRDKKWKILCDVMYTPNGMIGNIEAVQGIEELVLRKLVVESFSVAGETIRFCDPLEVQEQLDDVTGSYFVAEVPELDVIAYSEFQDELLPTLSEELANKWEWVVCAPDDELTKRALEVKQAFLRLVVNEVK